MDPADVDGRLSLPDGKPRSGAAAISPALAEAGTLLLDIGTKLKNIPGRGGYQINAYPTCSEAAIVPFGVGGGGSAKPRRERVAVVEDSRGRQAKTTVRRICRHNSLDALITFTYAEVPPLSMVGTHFNYLWRRYKLATGLPIPVYVLVCEWGHLHGRLHVHVGVAAAWWEQVRAVEVCPRCDKYGVLSKYPRALPPDYLCFGCLWGRGFVGRPERNADGKGLSGYLGKYLAKDLSGVVFDPFTGKRIDAEGALRVPFGGHRYRASIGAKPLPVKLWSPDLDVARSAAIEIAGGGRLPSSSWYSNLDEDSDLEDVEFHDFWEEVSDV